jgi:hypothetical protein
MCSPIRPVGSLTSRNDVEPEARPAAAEADPVPGDEAGPAAARALDRRDPAVCQGGGAAVWELDDLNVQAGQFDHPPDEAGRAPATGRHD